MSLKVDIKERNVIIAFFAIPIIMLIFGYFIYPYPPSVLSTRLTFVSLFIGLILLGVGYYLREDKYVSTRLKMMGWCFFAFYWSLQPVHLYYPSQDLFNAATCAVGVFFLFYLAYHEWLSLKLEDHPRFLDWIAGATFVAGMIYFVIDTEIVPLLKTGMIEVVSEQSVSIMRLFGLVVIRDGANIVYNNTPITIIFACTAIQSMVLFVGMNGALYNVDVKRRLVVILITILPVYFLNLLRNAGVIFMVGAGYLSFEMAHNVVFKLLSLVALIILLLINFKIVPELYDEIMCIFDLGKRDGPLEILFKKIFNRLRL
ncbi:MAG: archaeosortase A [Candidatus Thermoplasmatota archaeon]